MSKIRKFERLNKLTNEKEVYVGTSGKVLTISQEPKANKVSQKLYYIFTAEVDGPRGPLNVMGTVYENAFNFLGGKPEVGKTFGFAAKMEDLKERNNKLWMISGSEVDELTDEVFDDFDAIELS